MQVHYAILPTCSRRALRPIPCQRSEEPEAVPARDLTLGDHDVPPFHLGGDDLYAISPDGKEVAYTSNVDEVEATSPDEPAVDAGRFEADGHWAHPPHAWRADTPEQILERAEAVACIGRVLDELPPAQRAVVLLRDVEGLDAAEACGVLQVSEANQRVLLHRGRSKIRRALEKLLGDE